MIFKTLSRVEKQNAILAAVRDASRGQLIVSPIGGNLPAGSGVTVTELARLFRTTPAEIEQVVESHLSWFDNPDGPEDVFPLTTVDPNRGSVAVFPSPSPTQKRYVYRSP